MKREPLSRRQFLHEASALSLALMLQARGLGQAGEPLRRIERSMSPILLETPLAALAQATTPNDLFYVRNHFPVPTINAQTWRLSVGGAVEREVQLSLDDLRRMTSRSVTMTLECAGNSRGFLTPVQRGVQWTHGAVSTTEWTGVSLIDVLNRAGLRNNAVDVVLEGADRGEIVAEPRTPGVIPFARSVPIAKARQQDVLLAYRMGKADVPANHGAPLRAIVPGWFGMSSIKWLTRIVVTDRPFNGYFQSMDYSIYERRNGLAETVAMTQMQVKSVMVGPMHMQRIAPNTETRIHGSAWTGESEITRVEVSTDAGRTWTAARLLGEARAHSWRLWEHPWRTPAQAGRVTLMSRATDARGNTQPLQRDTDRRNYMVNHVVPVEVDVR
jgi:DMSO/TMAO reductase YedYZ molybdopterin-dependent catalytic subunit